MQEPRATFHAHFGNKEDLLASTIVHAAVLQFMVDVGIGLSPSAFGDRRAAEKIVGALSSCHAYRLGRRS